ncbi:hypothetical protein D3C83_320850 [compost metagenome]
MLLDRRDGGGSFDADDDIADFGGGSSSSSGSRPQSRPAPAFDSDLDDDVPF